MGGNIPLPEVLDLVKRERIKVSWVPELTYLHPDCGCSVSGCLHTFSSMVDCALDLWTQIIPPGALVTAMRNHLIQVTHDCLRELCSFILGSAQFCSSFGKGSLLVGDPVQSLDYQCILSLIHFSDPLWLFESCMHLRDISTDGLFIPSTGHIASNNPVLKKQPGAWESFNQ